MNYELLRNKDRQNGANNTRNRYLELGIDASF
jgi:hypothetical protein